MTTTGIYTPIQGVTTTYGTYYSPLPEAHVTVNRNRVRVHPNNYLYLQNNQEFEVELFNPTTKTVLAKLSLNGILISQAGLVLKPGQRVYLERFLESAKKFLFETYNIDNTETANQAIVNNGDIQVSFYDEYTPPQVYYRTPNVHFFNQRTGGSGSVTSFSGDATCGILTTTASINTSFNLSADKKETGRVEQGSDSKQKFVNYKGEFNSYSSISISFKILPYSAKPLEVKDLAVYCTNCGTKNKKNNYNFCPKCGTRFE